MSYCKVTGDGKDRIVFLTEEDHEKQKAAAIDVQEEVPEGPVFPNGEMNWACPCHGSMTYGPCAVEYRQFVTTCILPQERSEENVKDCFERHRDFEACISKYPTLYPELQFKSRSEEDQDSAPEQKDLDSNHSPDLHGGEETQTPQDSKDDSVAGSQASAKHS